jgi:biopolymer transport protein TolR
MHSMSRSSVVAVPNVTPMIDVMLVLLIIFMVVTPTLMHGVHAEPPVAENLKPRPEEELDHTLALDAFGALYLDTQPLAPERLGPALSALYPPESPNRVLYLKAHKELSYGPVADALEVASRSGVAVVGLVAEQRPAVAGNVRGSLTTAGADGRPR